MSLHLYHPYSVAARLAVGVRARHAMVSMVCAFYEWRERTRQRKMLARLDDRLLSDVGLSRSDVENEVAKPFWRA